MSLAKLTVVWLIASVIWIAAAFTLAFYGAWMSPVATTETGFARWASNQLEQNNAGNSALIMINQGEVTAEHFSGPQPVDQHTLFATASFSKWITALGVMSLVEQGVLDLDAPVSRYLKRWQLPASEFDHSGVTARTLLSHTAGLTDGLGYGDYLPDEEIPTLLESLRQPRASSGPRNIIVGQPPGEDFTYSGGGYLILQLLVEEVTGRSFAQHIQQTVFNPLGMSRSTYDYLGDQSNHSANFDETGRIVPTYRYASAAATGLSASADDLTQLVRGLTTANPKRPIKSDTLAQMLMPHGYFAGSAIWGLGTMLYVTDNMGNPVFGHDGANDPAINATVRINPSNQQGIIVITSGAALLATTIGSEWVLWQTGYPDFLFAERAILSALVPTIAGTTSILLLLLLMRRLSESRT